jgi:hypothetical protein
MLLKLLEFFFTREACWILGHAYYFISFDGVTAKKVFTEERFGA